MFVDASTEGYVGNLGLGGYKSLSSFYSHLSVSYSGGVAYDSISGYYDSDILMAGDSVIFAYSSSVNEITMYVNGEEAFSTSTYWIISSAGTNRSFYWGKPKTLFGAQWGDTYHGSKMPTNWFMKIEDLWIANNSNIDETEISNIAESINLFGDVSAYASYDTRITHHWSLREDLAADKGGIDFSKEVE